MAARRKSVASRSTKQNTSTCNTDHMSPFRCSHVRYFHRFYCWILWSRNTESRLAHLKYGEGELMAIEEHCVKRVPVVLVIVSIDIMEDDVTCKKISMMQSGRYWWPGKRWPCPLPPCLGILCPELSPRPSSLEPGEGWNIVNSCSITEQFTNDCLIICGICSDKIGLIHIWMSGSNKTYFIVEIPECVLEESCEEPDEEGCE